MTDGVKPFVVSPYPLAKEVLLSITTANARQTVQLSYYRKHVLFAFRVVAVLRKLKWMGQILMRES